MILYSKKFLKAGIIMLYKKNQAENLSMELFENPTNEYRGTPFWSWNCALNKGLLERNINYLEEMGFGGFHMHSRTGMATPYLSKEFMELVKFCTDKAEAKGMLSWLYDEDRWPSGAAGGLVTKDRKYSNRALLFTQKKLESSVGEEAAKNTGKPFLLACYDIIL